MPRSMKLARHPQSRADHTDGDRSSQDCVLNIYGIDTTELLAEKLETAKATSPHCNSCSGARSNLHCAGRSVGMIARVICPQLESPHAASGRLLFLVPVALGLYRAP